MQIRKLNTKTRVGLESIIIKYINFSLIFFLQNSIHLILTYLVFQKSLGSQNLKWNRTYGDFPYTFYPTSAQSFHYHHLPTRVMLLFQLISLLTCNHSKSLHGLLVAYILWTQANIQWLIFTMTATYRVALLTEKSSVLQLLIPLICPIPGNY